MNVAQGSLNCKVLIHIKSRTEIVKSIRFVHASFDMDLLMPCSDVVYGFYHFLSFLAVSWISWILNEMTALIKHKMVPGLRCFFSSLSAKPPALVVWTAAAVVTLHVMPAFLLFFVHRFLRQSLESSNGPPYDGLPLWHFDIKCCPAMPCSHIYQQLTVTVLNPAEAVIDMTTTRSRGLYWSNTKTQTCTIPGPPSDLNQHSTLVILFCFKGNGIFEHTLVSLSGLWVLNYYFQGHSLHNCVCS